MHRSSSKRRKPSGSTSSQDTSMSEKKQARKKVKTSDKQSKLTTVKTSTLPRLAVQSANSIESNMSSATVGLGLGRVENVVLVTPRANSPSKNTTTPALQENTNNEAEPTRGDLMRAIQQLTTDLNSKLDQAFKLTEELQGEIFILRQDNDKLAVEVEKCKKVQETLQQELKEANLCARIAAERSNDNEQYSRKNNVKILYVGESDGQTEKSEDSERIVLKIFNEKLGLRNIKSHDIDIAHRVGERKPGQKRPIIVKLLSRKVKNDIIANRRKLKGKSVVIVEDLTKANYQLFRQAADHPGALRAWTSDGKVFARSHDSRVHRISRLADLSYLSVGNMGLSTSSPSPSPVPSQPRPARQAKEPAKEPAKESFERWRARQRKDPSRIWSTIFQNSPSRSREKITGLSESETDPPSTWM